MGSWQNFSIPVWSGMAPFGAVNAQERHYQPVAAVAESNPTGVTSKNSKRISPIRSVARTFLKDLFRVR